MKIAIYIQDMRASGVARTMMAMARSFARHDETVVVAGHGDGIFGAADVAPAGFGVACQNPRGVLPRLAVVSHLRRTLREQRPDVVLSGGNFGHFSIWAATRGLGLPVVYVFSNAMERPDQPWRNRWRRFWSALLVRGSARSIVVGANLARSPVFAAHVASGKAMLIPNGLDLASVPEASGSVPGPMQGQGPVVLAIGRLQPQKNFEGLIDAVAEANLTAPLRLVVLGTGGDDYREALIARARGLGIADRVLFAGVTSDVFPWLRAASVFALASHWEGSSIALLEAMAAGAPIVASRSAGDAPDVLDEGRHGLLVDAGDTRGFAQALLRQIENPVLPGTRVRDYDAEVMMRAYHEVLTAVPARSMMPPARERYGTHPSQ